MHKISHEFQIIVITTYTDVQKTIFPKLLLRIAKKLQDTDEFFQVREGA